MTKSKCTCGDAKGELHDMLEEGTNRGMTDRQYLDGDTREEEARDYYARLRKRLKI